MRWLARVWGGPFKTPPLQQPITVGWVLLKLLETIWRLFLVVFIVAALAGGWVWMSQEQPLAPQVKVDVAQYSPNCKDPEYPVSVVITNDSNKTLGEIDLAFRLYEQGKSVNVATYDWARVELHDILKPNYRMQNCYRIPTGEPGSKAPYIVTADVIYAAAVSKDVPIAVEPPPIIRTNILGKTAKDKD